MTENLHKKLTDVLSCAGIRPALSEDETNVLPYVTFELPVEYRYDKDGPYKIVGNLTIRAVSDDFDEADDLCNRICGAIDEGFNGPAVEEENPVEIIEDEEYAGDALDDSSYSARLTDIRKDCMDGIWVIELDYILNQYA